MRSIFLFIWLASQAIVLQGQNSIESSSYASDQFIVYSYNNNGSSKSETLVVDPLEPYEYAINVSEDNINIKSNLKKRQGLVKYNIYNSTNSLLKRKKNGIIDSENTSILINDLSKGTYILEIESENKRKSFKFIK